jgi:hypothetical protein
VQRPCAKNLQGAILSVFYVSLMIFVGCPFDEGFLKLEVVLGCTSSARGWLHSDPNWEPCRIHVTRMTTNWRVHYTFGIRVDFNSKWLFTIT